MADPIDTSPSGHPPGYGALIWSTHPTNHLQVPGSTPQGPRYSILNSNGYGGYNHCGHISIHQIASAMTNNALNTPPETKRVQLLVSVRTSDRTQHQQYDGIKMRWGRKPEQRSFEIRRRRTRVRSHLTCTRVVS